MYYKVLLAKVMQPYATLEDWKAFRKEFDALPQLVTAEGLRRKVSPEVLKELNQRNREFVEAAHHVASILTEEEAAQDVALALAYGEIHSHS